MGARLKLRRVKTPTIIQMEAVECGAAALGIVLAYYGRFVPLETLRIECGVSRDGSKASNIVKAARGYGLEAKGFRKEIEQLADVRLPCIIFWEMNHFVVLEGAAGGRFFINDPASGPRVVTAEEFDLSFSGVVLSFSRGAGFQRGGKKSSLLDGLKRRLSGSRIALTFIVLCGLFLVLPGLILPSFTRIFVDEVLVGGRGHLFRPLIAGMVLTALVQMALTSLQEYYLLRLETRTALVESGKFFYHLLRLPIVYFSQRFAGEIGSRVQINDKVASVLSGQLATTVIDCVLVVFYAGLMFIYDVPLTVVVLVITLLNGVAVRWAARRRTDATRSLVQQEGKLLGAAMSGLAMIETLKATGAEGEFFARWAGHQARALGARQRVGLIGQYVDAVPGLVMVLVQTSVLLLGGLKVMEGEMTVGMLVAYQYLVNSLTKPINSFVGLGSTLQELVADMNRLDDVLEQPQDRLYSFRRHPSVQQAVKLSGRIELRNVTFGYSPLDKPLVENFSLVIEPGQRVGLVGPSGSGKSTLVRLVCGLYEPWEGEILFDGLPRQELDHELVSSSLAYVDQSIFLFEGSVRENLTLWDLTVPTARVVAAARDAEIEEHLQARHGTYEAPVGELGGNFSGGQRQRLEIARALIGDPSILVLDEATSALDPPTEQLIDRHLRRRGCTTLISAHRLSTIRDCDEIIVMQAGKIAERGTHQTLKRADGLYAFLIRG